MTDDRGEIRKPVWCWEAGPYRSDGTGSSCTLPDGHDGEHLFTPDDEITVLFDG